MIKRFFVFQSGFTLIEVMTSIIIIGVLASLILPNFTRIIKRNKAQEAPGILSSLYKAQKDFETDTNSFTTNINDLDLALPAAPKNFTAPVLSNGTDTDCDCAGGSLDVPYLAKMTSNDTSYTLYITRDTAQIVCTPCTNVCQELGYSSF